MYGSVSGSSAFTPQCNPILLCWLFVRWCINIEIRCIHSRIITKCWECIYYVNTHSTGEETTGNGSQCLEKWKTQSICGTQRCHGWLWGVWSLWSVQYIHCDVMHLDRYRILMEYLVKCVCSENLLYVSETLQYMKVRTCTHSDYGSICRRCNVQNYWYSEQDLADKYDVKPSSLQAQNYLDSYAIPDELPQSRIMTELQATSARFLRICEKVSEALLVFTLHSVLMWNM